MNIQQLEYLLALRKYRHFVRAAEECGVTQPTLSAMIAKLEDELGVKLLDRSSQPLSLSAIGERVADQALEVLRGVKGIEGLAAEERDKVSGEVSIGILPTVAPFLLPRLLPICHKHMGNMEIRFVELTTSACEAALRDGAIDVAILAGDLQENKFVTHNIYYEEFVGYVSRNEPLYSASFIRSSEIDPRSLWLLDEGHCFRNQLIRFCEFKKTHPKKINFTLGGIETYMRLVEAGQGVTFVPELAIESLSKSQKELLRRFAIPRPVRPVMLVHTPTYMRAKVIDHLTTLIRMAVPERMHILHKDQTMASRFK